MADENEEVRPCNLTETREEFYDDDVVIVDSLLHNTAKMPAKTSLPQNVLAGRIAPPFIPNSTTTVAGAVYVYNGLLYTAKKVYQGPWASNKFTRSNLNDVIDNLPKSFCTNEVLTRLTGNRLDDSEFSRPPYYIGSNGAISNTSGAGESGFCPCVPGEVLSFYVEGNENPNQLYSPITFFDLNKHYLSQVVSSDLVRKQTVPSGAYYFRIVVQYDANDKPARMVAANFVPDRFISYSTSYEKIKNVVDDVFKAENIFDPSACTTGQGYISDVVNGEEVWTSTAAFSESDFIDVRQRCLFIWHDYLDEYTTLYDGWPWWTFCQYDADKNPLRVSTPSSTQPQILRPLSADAAFIRFSVPVAYADKISVGYNKFTEFVPYGVKPKFLTNLDVVQSSGDSETKMMSQKAVTELVASLDPSGLGAHWNGKKWYAYGTSITDTTPTGKYVQPLAQMSGLVLTDKGIGGGGIGDLGGYSHGQVFNAICNTTDGKLEADLITLETGPNDTAAEVPLGTIYDTTQETLAGCLNLCLRYLQTNTNAQVVVISSVATNIQPNAADKYYEWFMMIRDICFINKVKFIAAPTNMGYAKLTASNKRDYVVDNIHQTELGGYIYAESIWAELRNVPLFRTVLPS